MAKLSQAAKALQMQAAGLGDGRSEDDHGQNKPKGKEFQAISMPGVARTAEQVAFDEALDAFDEDTLIELDGENIKLEQAQWAGQVRWCAEQIATYDDPLEIPQAIVDMNKEARRRLEIIERVAARQKAKKK